MRKLPASLPNTGTVSIDLTVERGNLLDVVLTTLDQIDNMKARLWNQVKVHPDPSCGKPPYNAIFPSLLRERSCEILHEAK